MRDKTKGYILGAIAAATYGMNPLLALPLYHAGMHADSVLFYRYIIAIPILAILVLWRKQSFKIQKREIVLLIIAGLLMAFSSLTLFLSYNYMDAGIASTILFIYPVIVSLLMIFFFKEKFKLQTSICILLTLCGIALLYKGDNGQPLNTIGLILVVLSALSYAIYIVGVNNSTLKKIPTVRLTFYVLVFGSVLLLAKVGFGTKLEMIPKWYYWGNVLALAILPTVVSFLCTTQAIHYIGSTPTAILGALEPVTAVIIGATVFGERLTPRIIFGIIIIILAVSIIVGGDRISEVMVRFRKFFPKPKKSSKKNI